MERVNDLSKLSNGLTLTTASVVLMEWSGDPWGSQRPLYMVHRSESSSLLLRTGLTFYSHFLWEYSGVFQKLHDL